MEKKIFKLAVLPAILLSSFSTFAATSVNLSQQSASYLKSQILMSDAMGIKELNRSTDFNQTLHIRFKQTYQGHYVWGGDGIVHIPHAHDLTSSLTLITTPESTMNGTLYRDIQADLAQIPASVTSSVQADKVLQYAITTYQQKNQNQSQFTNQKNELIVYIDKDNKARWAYQISFNVAPVKSGELPQKPIMIIDAQTFQIYKQWDDIKTYEYVGGGGFGGNNKMGKLVYDGLTGHLAKLKVSRDSNAKHCRLDNKDVEVFDKRTDLFMEYDCAETNSEHGYVYWSGNFDEVNGAFSPANDALYAGAVIKDMYQDWYHIPVLKMGNDPMKLKMVVHEVDLENAYWDGEQMTFGDGGSSLYPLTSLGIAAHEISHGFTSQHSNLDYTGQSGGMNESFSDMAAQAAEFYAYGKSSWLIGAEVMKKAGETIRYMDQPTKDCKGWPAGWLCSIDSADQYGWGFLDVHHSSGVYNHFFYLLATTKGWDSHKAFDVMVQANAHYWNHNETFESAACGVITATKDYGYDLQAVQAAFKKVVINTSQCV